VLKYKTDKKILGNRQTIRTVRHDATGLVLQVDIGQSSISHCRQKQLSSKIATSAMPCQSMLSSNCISIRLNENIRPTGALATNKRKFTNERRLSSRQKASYHAAHRALLLESQFHAVNQVSLTLSLSLSLSFVLSLSRVG
jgi:hypothetical protein